MLAVGEHLLGQLDDQTLRMTSGLAGGVGCTQQEMCGALSGGVLLIGAIHGRSSADEDISRCWELAARYRERFAQELGATLCCALRASKYGPGGTPCSALVERAANILLDVLNVESKQASR